MFLYFQISINGLEVLCLMVDRMGEDFKPHISSGFYFNHFMRKKLKKQTLYKYHATKVLFWRNVLSIIKGQGCIRMYEK